MKWSRLMLGSVLAVLAFVILGCTSSIDFLDGIATDGRSETENWQVSVDAIREMTRGQPIPQHLIDPEKPMQDDTFDPNQLLTALPHLSLHQGYSLDFVYRYDGMGGRPILYAREESAAPYESYEAYQDAYGVEDLPYDAYFEYIETDGTEEGYFQWLVMRVMGGQFYLYWHSGYDDAEFIASKARLDEMVDEMASTEFGEPLTSSQRRKALNIDPAPVVEITGDLVTVSVIWFTRWGGFYESVYTLTASTPHKIIDTQTQQRVPYDCQILF